MLSTTQGDPIRVADYNRSLGPGQDFTQLSAEEWPISYIDESYSFEASRAEMIVRTELGATTLNRLAFEYSYTATQHNIQLPAHIANYAYGSVAAAVELAGPSRREQAVRVSVAQAIDNEYDLHVCEKMKYFDADECLVAELCSCPYPQEAEGQTVISQSESIEMVEADDKEEAREQFLLTPLIDANLPLYFRNDATDHMELCDGAPTLDELDDAATDYNREHRELVTATRILGSMRKAFRQQLGISA
ncbi:MAG: hypothetical protein UY35_C0008G0047 [Candidatus Saccharibacteria bacterium GW2011_GWC2_48_9]|nr:MAG: hypothetical protein UY35_C0008G0047 [Candidatus Saccharibacteria bacterium GW2011_GWC2_48_9]